MTVSDVPLPQCFPVACHTDNVGPGSTFVAIAGKKEDGAAYIAHAVEKGATTIVVQEEAILSEPVLDILARKQVSLERVKSTRAALAELSARAHGYPAEKLTIIGITGTKGKTTTAYLLAHILRTIGHKTALLSTVENQLGDFSWRATLTTQHPDYLHTFFAACVERGVTHVVMEVAAQALSLSRVAGITFSGIIFTNFEREHSEFYESIEDYFAAKYAIFSQRQPDAPVLINADDVWGKKILDTHSDFLRFGLFGTGLRVQARNFQVAEGISAQVLVSRSLDLRELEAEIEIEVEGEEGFVEVEQEYWAQEEIVCPTLIGRFNLYNLLAALGMAVELGVPLADAGAAVSSFGFVPGRLQGSILSNGARSFIDYAHTPASFEQVLSTLREATDHLIVVFGAGGERDAHKRPRMGEIAAQYADLIVVTTDNPRSEDAQEIAQNIVAGISEDDRHKVICELDREAAIKKAYALSGSSSILALLGKGPDEYQQVGLVKHPFSEMAILSSL